MHSTLAAASVFALALPLALAPTAPEVVPALIPAVEPIAAEPVLPLPDGPLVISSTGSNLADLASQISGLTGVGVCASSPALSRLADSPTGLLADASIEPEAAWSYFESLIAQAGFVMIEMRASSPRLLAIVDELAGDITVAQAFRPVPADELHLYADHPALLIETVVHLESVDVRQLSNSMRSMIGGSPALTMVPGGHSGSMVLQGTGARLAGMARFMHRLDAEETAVLKLVRESGDTGSADGRTDG